MDIEQFQKTVWGYYHAYGRDLPWRNAEADGSFDPYKILVSEIMLQQTQANRVVPKYQQFLKTFPTVQALAKAPLASVLTTWSGLGYNRRAKFLWLAAQRIVSEYNGIFPDSHIELQQLPGVGANTAGAICAYAFNQPVAFIETNIRSVFIYHFFQNKTGITDSQLLPYIKNSLDTKDPREWYWALMDYGVYLKSTVGNTSRDSKHYAKQSTFAGSKRQIRGHIIRELTTGPRNITQLRAVITDSRLSVVLHDLHKEELIRKQGNQYML